jgi:hypothetical protein
VSIIYCVCCVYISIMGCSQCMVYHTQPSLLDDVTGHLRRGLEPQKTNTQAHSTQHVHPGGQTHTRSMSIFFLPLPISCQDTDGDTKNSDDDFEATLPPAETRIRKRKRDAQGPTSQVGCFCVGFLYVRHGNIYTLTNFN